MDVSHASANADLWRMLWNSEGKKIETLIHFITKRTARSMEPLYSVWLCPFLKDSKDPVMLFLFLWHPLNFFSLPTDILDPKSPPHPNFPSKIWKPLPGFLIDNIKTTKNHCRETPMSEWGRVIYWVQEAVIADYRSLCFFYIFTIILKT